ncbi:glycosyltransferase family 4 protein [Butyrivibrio sp. VCD2006]|uniref:glycosyltransferase family 4 protein n=1 Tax=Butyrivibrio sp. VCD2006 TaxID=1280664 RepID=UPI00042A6800|nr:glycosyltransferase family 4 protein [Butyrivibrio sp. VCD2006]
MVREVLKQILPYTLREQIRSVIFNANYLRIKRIKTDFGEYPDGINLIGHSRGDFGLGESCRLVAQTIKTSGIPFVINNCFQNKKAKETNLSFVKYEEDEPRYNVNLIHINPNEMVSFSLRSTRNMFDNRYQVAFWLWEVPEFPMHWVCQIKMFDEIWTPSEFVSESIRRVTDKPVFTVPYAMREPKVSLECDRNYFGLPRDKFLFLMSYDGLSNSERKNPEAVIAAYKEAYPEEQSGVGLIIKATHANEKEIKRLRNMLEGYRNVYILTESFSKEEFNSLIKDADVYVSLHRSEGFGLVMAEAMFLGTPVVATNWSANSEFMSEESCCMVPARIVEIETDMPPYHKGNHWADPDIHVAAGYIRRLYDDKAFYDYKKESAFFHIREMMKPERAADIFRERFAELTKKV